MFPYRFESSAAVEAPAADVFAYLDDHRRLASHMSKPSLLMGGGQMALSLDNGRGQQVGSLIKLAGRVWGMQLSVEETVTERNPPFNKAWETIGSPRLLVVGPYRMGFQVTPELAGSRARVFIEYALPKGLLSGWLGRLLGRYYAEWCTERMVADAVRHFKKGP
jgi:hypothetical protein